MRISTTTLESFRLFCQPDNEWMTEQELLDTIAGRFIPNHKVLLGLAFGKVLEDPDRYLVPGGYRYGEFFFSLDTVQPCLDVIDRRGVFEAKADKAYGDCTVVAKADHLLGRHLSEFKTTLSPFDPEKYAQSCQWRFMADIFEPSKITYHVFCLTEDDAGIVSLRGVESMNLFPYANLHQDCCDLLEQFKGYVIAKGLDGLLRQRQADAVGAL